MITVPFNLMGDPDTLIVFEAILEGRTLLLALDTGAGVTLLHSRVAAAVTLGNEVLGFGAGGETAIQFGTVPTLCFGDTELTDVPVGISDSVQVIADKIGVPVDGVLGFPALANWTLEIDFTEGLFRLTDERIEGPALAMDSSGALAIIETDGRFAIDTGASRSLLCPDYVRRRGLDLTPGPDVYGSGGPVPTFEAGPLRIALHDQVITLNNVLCSNFLAELSTAIDTHLDGILGLEILSQFHVWFDYPGGLFRAIPR
jgi:hypothetical protein